MAEVIQNPISHLISLFYYVKKRSWLRLRFELRTRPLEYLLLRERGDTLKSHSQLLSSTTEGIRSLAAHTRIFQVDWFERVDSINISDPNSYESTSILGDVEGPSTLTPLRSSLKQDQFLGHRHRNSRVGGTHLIDSTKLTTCRRFGKSCPCWHRE